MLSSLRHISQRTIFITHALAWLCNVFATGVAIVCLSDPLAQISLLAISLLVVTLVEYQLIIRCVRLPLLLEDRITKLSSSTDAFQLTEISIASPVAARWNELVQQAKLWQAARSLLQSLETRSSNSPTNQNDALLDALAEGIMLTDQAGTIRYVNHGFQTLFDTKEATRLESCHWTQLFWQQEKEIQEHLELVKTRSSFDLNRQNAGGETRVLRCQRRPYRSESGEKNGHIWTIRDITQQRLAEDMRENFLATATHELRTPLANIHAYAESLTVADDIDPESQKKFYNIIQAEAARLTKLINDLLDVNRMQAGSFSLDLHETDLARLVEEAAKKVQAQSQEKHLEFRIDISPKLPKVMVDKSKLVSALVNLLGNAMKYTPEHGRVSFAVDANAQQLEFVVTDTGIGIAPEELPHVFDKFFRSDDERVRDIPGSGLGLAFTQEVARLHGGDIEVASVLNKGSTFRLTLPLELNA